MAANSFGRFLTVTIFGESHGTGIGVVIDGVPPELPLDTNLVQAELNRRRPGQSSISTPRAEEDICEILSGVLNQKTTGAPIAMFIRNKDTRSKDYLSFQKVPRPSQIDYPAMLRYGSNVDLRGSGKFSGRLTASVVMAGVVAKQILSHAGIKMAAYVSQVGDIADPTEYSVRDILKSVNTSPVRTVDQALGQKMVALIEKIKAENDSIGGMVSVRVENFPAGIGDPWFHSLESDLAAGILSIPAVRGIEFGTGFAAASMRGSEHNDPYLLEKGNVSTKTNHCGGIIGGISIGTPITIRVPVKPTASISQAQKTLNLETNEIVDLTVEGRHDPCIVPRAMVGIEAMTALVLADHILAAKSYRL